MTAAGTCIALLTLAGLLGSGAYFWFSEAIAHGPLADGETGSETYLPLGYFGEGPKGAGVLGRRRGGATPFGYAGTGETSHREVVL